MEPEMTEVTREGGVVLSKRDQAIEDFIEEFGDWDLLDVRFGSDGGGSHIEACLCEPDATEFRTKSPIRFSGYDVLVLSVPDTWREFPPKAKD